MVKKVKRSYGFKSKTSILLFSYSAVRTDGNCIQIQIKKRKKSWFLTSKQHKVVCLKGLTGKCGRTTTIYTLIIQNPSDLMQSS